MIREPREHGMEIDGRRDDRRVQNELLFRAVNEKLRELNIEFEGFANETAVFVCECNRIECMAQMELGVDAFDAVCAQPLRFVVMPGHELPGVEQVVDRNGRYVVVEKLALQA
jgi:hypothetical protein